MPQQIDSLPVPPLPRSRHRTKSCPFCAETIRYEAIKCRFCGEFLAGDRQPEGKRRKAEDGGWKTASPDSTEDAAGEESGTEVLWFGRPSVLALSGTFLKVACFAAVCGAVYRYRVTALITYLPKVSVSIARLMQVEGWLDLGALGLAVVALLVLVWKVLSLKSHYYEVTPDRVEWSHGVLDRKVDNLDMFRVIDLKLRRSLLECLFGVGTVTVLTSDESNPQFEFLKVHHCRYLYDTLKQSGLNADKKQNVVHVE